MALPKPCLYQPSTLPPCCTTSLRRRMISACDCGMYLCGILRDISTGAGGDNGIAKMSKCRGISVSSYYDQSHYLPPHP
jgi:hypothetical protein